MPDFNVTAPPKSVTDPTNTPIGEFPRHLYKFVAEKPDDPLIVGWRGKQPIYNEILVVTNDATKADAVAEGYSVTPVLDAPKAKK